MINKANDILHVQVYLIIKIYEKKKFNVEKNLGRLKSKTRGCHLNIFLTKHTFGTWMLEHVKILFFMTERLAKIQWSVMCAS